MSTQVLASQLRLGLVIKFDGSSWEITRVSKSASNATVDFTVRNCKINSTREISTSVGTRFPVMEVIKEDFDYMYDDGVSIYAIDGRDFSLSKMEPNALESISKSGKFRVATIDGEIYKISSL